MDTSTLLREKEDQVKRMEKWIEGYKEKIQVNIHNTSTFLVCCD